MCGISLFVAAENLEVDLNKSLDSIKHRGPDNKGYEILKCNKLFVGMGHQRLSIIDLDERSNQPMTIDGIKIIFNGEIYNHISLREKLVNKGVSFETNSDTEVILKTYQRYGTEGFKQLNGIFSFIIYHDSKIIIARDFFGVKPLYYTFERGNLFVSSEIKGIEKYGIKPKISADDIFEFMNCHFISKDRTGFENIKKIKRNSVLIYDLNDKNIKESYIYSNSDIKNFNFSLAETVRSQEISDVNNTILFSGGVDSSVLAAIANCEDLHHVKYFNDHPDTIASKKISKHLSKNLHEITFKKNELSTIEFIESIDVAVDGIEELIADFTYLSSKEICEEIKKGGYKVCLSGMGGDELFLGYPRHTLMRNKFIFLLLHPFLSIAPVSKFLNQFFKNGKLNRFLSYADEKYQIFQYFRLLGYFSTVDLKKIYKENYDQYNFKLEKKYREYINQKNEITDLLEIEIDGFLQRNLIVADKSSMNASIEMRVPLIDLNIYSKLISKEFKSNGKMHLKKEAEKNIPKKLLNRNKEGFNPPLQSFIHNLDWDDFKKYTQILKKLFNNDISEIISEKKFEIFKKENPLAVWQLLYLSRWIKRYS